MGRSGARRGASGGRLHLALILLLGCAYRLGAPDVTWGEVEPLPLVRPSTDGRRWYVPLDSERLGPHLLFVDTGYSFTTCDDDLIDALGLPTRGRVRVRGELGHAVGTKARLPPMVLGGHLVEGVVCQVRDLNETSSIRDPREVPIAGVLGMDVLRRFRLVFDPEKGLVELYDPNTTGRLPPRGEGIIRVRRERFGTRARVPLVVSGETTWPVIDTGASETYLDAARLGLQPDWEQADVTVRGTGSSGSVQRTLTYYSALVDIAGHDLGTVTVTGRRRSPLTPGLVGLDVLANFRQEYDFIAKRALFTPVTAPPLPTWKQWRDAPKPRLEGGRLLDGATGTRPDGS